MQNIVNLLMNQNPLYFLIVFSTVLNVLYKLYKYNCISWHVPILSVHGSALIKIKPFVRIIVGDKICKLDSRPIPITLIYLSHTATTDTASKYRYIPIIWARILYTRLTAEIIIKSRSLAVTYRLSGATCAGEERWL